MILNFGLVSAENVQFKNALMPPWAYLNPILHHTNQHQTTLSLALGLTHEPSQNITTWIQSNMNGYQVATIPQPVPESSTFLLPHGVRPEEPWTETEHQLFLAGLIMYGKGHWKKIARHFLGNKTPQQVQSYVAGFFWNLPATHFFNFRRRKPTNHSAGKLMARNGNLMSAPTSRSMQMVLKKPQQTLTLFPEEAHFSQVSPFGEGSSSSNHIDGFQMLTGGASTSLTTSSNGEVDLELRLG
ncbi:SANT/Myb domain [Sesbania bispinosa]|nr:SANT/Myb domain [Sesbania bispinosa]